MGKYLLLLAITVGILTGLRYSDDWVRPQPPQVCEIPEAKTITFLEGELGKAFDESDRHRYEGNWYKDALRKCQSRTDKQLCEDRNLWMRRAHQGQNMPIPPEMEMDCSAF